MLGKLKKNNRKIFMVNFISGGENVIKKTVFLGVIYCVTKW